MKKLNKKLEKGNIEAVKSLFIMLFDYFNQKIKKE